jgi:hypothetical protein
MVNDVKYANTWSPEDVEELRAFSLRYAEEVYPEFEELAGEDQIGEADR